MKTVATHHQRAPAEPGVCSRCCPAESLRVQRGGRGRRSFSRSKEVRTFASSDAPLGTTRPRQQLPVHLHHCPTQPGGGSAHQIDSFPGKKKCVYIKKKTSCLRGEVSHMALQHERSSTGRPDLCFPTGCSLKKPSKSSLSLSLSLGSYFFHLAHQGTPFCKLSQYVNTCWIAQTHISQKTHTHGN